MLAETWFELVGETPARATRHTSDPLNIRRQAANSELRRNFFSCRVAESWNMLPSEVKSAESVKIFKNKIAELVKQ